MRVPENENAALLEDKGWSAEPDQQNPRMQRAKMMQRAAQLCMGAKAPVRR
jgi:hypothetical protein